MQLATLAPQPHNKNGTALQFTSSVPWLSPIPCCNDVLVMGSNSPHSIAPVCAVSASAHSLLRRLSSITNRILCAARLWTLLVNDSTSSVDALALGASASPAADWVLADDAPRMAAAALCAQGATSNAAGMGLAHAARIEAGSFHSDSLLHDKQVAWWASCSSTRSSRAAKPEAGTSGGAGIDKTIDWVFFKAGSPGLAMCTGLRF